MFDKITHSCACCHYLSVIRQKTTTTKNNNLHRDTDKKVITVYSENNCLICCMKFIEWALKGIFSQVAKPQVKITSCCVHGWNIPRCYTFILNLCCFKDVKIALCIIYWHIAQNCTGWHRCFISRGHDLTTFWFWHSERVKKTV